MSLPTLRVSSRLRELLAYDKLAGPQPRVLVLRGQYWLDDACLRAAEALGWDTCGVPVVMEGFLSREAFAELLQALAHFRPDFVLSVNLSGMDTGGMLARLLADLRMPHVAWFVDNPRTILMGRDIYASDWSVAATWDRAYSSYLDQCGFRRTFHLPLAADLALFNAEPAESWDFPPTFVGDSNTALAQRQWAVINERAELAEAVRRAFAEGRVTRERFAAGLEALLDSGDLDRLDENDRRHAEYLFFTEGTRRLRAEWIHALEPEGVGVRGDDGWKGLCLRSGPPLDYRRELPAFYRSCAVNLNITSLQMSGAVNQRVFDCPAAGGFLLTDAQADLFELFEPDTEVAAYSSTEECRDRLRHFRANPKARVGIAAAARRRILAQHTYAHRLERIVEVVKDTFGR